MSNNRPPRTPVERALRLLIVATAFLFLISCVLGVIGFVANHNRINDIQRSRTASCQHTYEAFNQVFRPFFPPPKDRTAQQKKDHAKLERTIRQLERNCSHQTSARK